MQKSDESGGGDDKKGKIDDGELFMTTQTGDSVTAQIKEGITGDSGVNICGVAVAKINKPYGCGKKGAMRQQLLNGRGFEFSTNQEEILPIFDEEWTIVIK